MAAHLFNESGQMQEVDIPDIFDVLEGGEDENAVKFLLGFSAEEPAAGGDHVIVSQGGFASDTSSGSNPNLVLLTKEGKPRKRDPVDPSRCIFSCERCSRAFTTKFNLKRHINLHCSPSKEAGVPVQGPPSASMPSRKARERREAMAALGLAYQSTKGRPKNKKNGKSFKAKKKSSSQIVHVNPANAHSTIVLHNSTSSKPILTTVQSLPAASNIVVKPPTKKTFGSSQPQMINNNGIQTQKFGLQKHQIEVKIATQSGQQQQQQQQQQIVLSNRPILSNESQHQQQQQQQQVYQLRQLPEKSFQIVKTVQQHPQQQQQLSSQQSVYQPRVVQSQSKQHHQHQGTTVQTSIATTQSQDSYPLIQQGMVQGIPVTVSFVPSASKVIFKEGVIHLPQQPLPNVQAIQSALQLRPITSTVSSLQHVPLMVSAPTTSTVGRHTSLTQNVVAGTLAHGGQKTTNGVGTITASIISSSFLPARCHNSQEFPPEELFDSEDDDEDASSVATTTEAPSPEPEMNGDKFAVYRSVERYSNNDDGNAAAKMNETSSKASLVNVIVSTNPTVSEEDDADNNDAALNLPSNPQRGQLQEIPKGWLRKIITTGKSGNQPKVFYYNKVGKKFSCQEEIDQFFSRLGQTVMPGLFNFEPPKLVDEDDDEDDEDQEMEDHSTFGSLQQKQQQLTA